LKFNNCSKIVPISHEQWFMLENVRNILDLFDNATEVLSGGEIFNVVFNCTGIENDKG